MKQTDSSKWDGIAGLIIKMGKLNHCYSKNYTIFCWDSDRFIRKESIERRTNNKKSSSFKQEEKNYLNQCRLEHRLSEDMTTIESITAKSSILRFMILLKDTVTFQWKVTVELIKEQQDEVQKLHEYHKRWQAFVWSMIKIDELLIPISKCVNQIYQILYPGYPWFPWFSILRFFVNLWHREVYKPLQQIIENVIVEFLKDFHQGWKDYSREQKLTK